MLLASWGRRVGTRRAVGAVAVAFAFALQGAAPALAIEGPGDPDPIPGTFRATLTVTSDGGRVTGTGIDCPGDCSQLYSYPSSEAPPVVRLTATPPNTLPGWKAVWTGCVPVADTHNCDVTMDGTKGVTLAWQDGGAPVVDFAARPDPVGPVTKLTATFSDNLGTFGRIDWYVDDVKLPLLSGTEATWNQLGFNQTKYGHSTTHKVTIIGYDPAGNASTPVAHTFRIDKQAAFQSIQADPAIELCPTAWSDSCDRPHFREPPAFSWTHRTDGVDGYCYTGDINSNLEFYVFENPCSSGHQPEIPDSTYGGNPQLNYDRVWQTVVVARDQLGNSREYVYQWVLDRRRPSVSAPPDGAIVTTPITPSFFDAFTSVAEIVRSCELDSAPMSCENIVPSDGLHTLKVTARDKAGNENVVTRSFRYDTERPEAEITSGPEEGAIVRPASRSVTIGFSASDSGTAITKTCKLDRGAFGSCTGANSHTMSALTPGIHTFTLRVVDGAGRETLVSRQFVFDDPFPTNARDDDREATPPTTPPTTSKDPDTIVEPIPLAGGRVAPRFSVRRGRTSVKKLVVRGLARGSQVRVSCKGGGCPKSKRYRVKRGKVDATKQFRKRTLRPGAVIEIRVTLPAHTTKAFRYTTRKGGKKPTLTALCFTPGAGTPASCT